MSDDSDCIPADLLWKKLDFVFELLKRKNKWQVENLTNQWKTAGRVQKIFFGKYLII